VGGLVILAGGCGASRSGRSTSKPRPVAGNTAGREPVPRKLQAAVKGQVIEPGSAGFNAASHVYNERFDAIVPRAIVRPLDAEDVSGAVRWGVGHGVPIRARSGGHSYAGYSTIENGVVLDLRSLRRIDVDRSAGTATIGAGAQLIDVYAGLAARGATIPAGSCPSVGIGGHALGGGMGLAGRAFGLASDHIIGVELVSADGMIRQVDRQTDPDLLWAVCGAGGGNFGVVTAVRLAVRPLPASAAWFFVSWPWSEASDAIAAWQAWAPHARDELTSILHLDAGGGEPAVSVAGQYLGPSSELTNQLAPLTAVAGARVSYGDQDYLGLQLRWAGCLGQPSSSCQTVGTEPGGALTREYFSAKSDYLVRPLSGPARQTLIAALERRQDEPGTGAVLFDAYGGAINRVDPSATAFVHRDALCCIQYLSYDGGDSWLRETWAGLRSFVSGQAYQNYIDPDLADWRRAYYGANYSRLAAMQSRIDPEHYFRFPQAIGT
jgi:hypothetical protein